MWILCLFNIGIKNGYVVLCEIVNVVFNFLVEIVFGYKLFCFELLNVIVLNIGLIMCDVKSGLLLL